MDIIHMFSKISDILNIGKLDIDIKSLTHHKNILSIKFHSVQAISKLRVIFQKSFFLYSNINKKSELMLIIIIILIFTLIHRDIHLFSIGSIILIFER